MKKMKLAMQQWMKNEEGFQVFEKFGLTQGGVLLALGIAAVSILVMNDYWSNVGDEYFSSGGLHGMNPNNAGTGVTEGWGTSTENPWN